jgi:hypothetical protein
MSRRVASPRISPARSPCLGKRQRPKGEHLHHVVKADRALARGEDRENVHVLTVVLPRPEHVTRVATDADVRHVGMVRESVERCVRLDEPTVGLRVEVGTNRCEIASQHVEPGRDEIE